MLKPVKRIVIKVGTSILTSAKSSALASIVAECADLRSQKIEMLMVTSGAIGAGIEKLGWAIRPKEIPKKQAAAAIGQVALMQGYQQLFEKYKIRAAQVLLTRNDLDDRNRYMNIRNTLLTLLKLGAIPIINENDTVSVEEIQFGDNDKLSALVAAKIDADLLIILTDVEGLIDKYGRTVPLVAKITPEIENLSWKNSKSRLGTGGMTSKIDAAKISTASGVTTVIANGFRSSVITDIFNGKSVGTKFVSMKSLSAKEKWILFGAIPKGEVIVDSGASRALTELNKSLLPAGIVKAKGSFRKGEVVKIKSEEDRELARGVISFSAEEVEKIKGKKSGEINKILNFASNSFEVIHRDSLVLIP